MSFQNLKRGIAACLLLAGLGMTIGSSAWAQDEGTRKTKTKVSPSYPDLARRMRISGVVKVQVTVAPNGTIRETKLVGGHPVLANAVIDAVKQWRYEASPQETTENLEFHFNSPEQ